MRKRQHNALTYRVELGVIRLRDLLAATVTEDGPFDRLSDLQWSSLFGKRGCRPAGEAL